MTVMVDGLAREVSEEKFCEAVRVGMEAVRMPDFIQITWYPSFSFPLSLLSFFPLLLP